jgi:hypothetical protein
VTVTFKLDPDDYWRFQKHVLRSLRGVVLIPVAALLLWAWSFLSPLLQRGEWWSAAAAVATLVVLVPFGYRAMRRGAVQAAVVQEGALEPRTVRIDRDGVWCRTTATEGRTSWNAIEKVESDRYSIYLYTSPRCAIFVPRRAFPTARDADLFVEAAQEYQRTAAA